MRCGNCSAQAVPRMSAYLEGPCVTNNNDERFDGYAKGRATTTTRVTYDKVHPSGCALQFARDVS